jgi:competence protein ComEC
MHFAFPAFIVGNLLFANLSMRIESALLGMLIPLCVLCVLCVRHSTCRFTSAALLGALCALASQQIELDRRLPAIGQRIDSELVGRIVSLPRQQGFVTQFLFRVLEGPLRDRQLRLTWYRAETNIRLGDSYRLWARLASPSGTVNFSGFDYEKWLFTQRIHGRGYVLSDPAPILVEVRCSFCLASLRAWLRNELEAQRAFSARGTHMALALGDTSGLHPAQWQVLNRTGTTHLLIVSGLHISLVAVLAYAVFGVAGLPVFFRISLTLAVTLGYALIGGWGLPVQRAFVMTAAFFSATLLRRHVTLMGRFTLAMFAVLLFDPLASLGRGFWLSFGVVLALILALTRYRSFRSNKLSGLLATSRAQWIAYLSLLPLIGFFNQEIPIASFAVNLIAIPWVSFLIVPLILISIVLLLIHQPLASYCLDLSALLVKWLWAFLSWCAGLDFVLPVSQLHPLVLVCALVGIFIVLMPKGLSYRWPGFILTTLLLSRSAGVKDGVLVVTFMDVGQGLSVLIETPRHAVLYDTGPAFDGGFSAAAQTVLPALRGLGIAELQAMVVSHSDNDHAGGERDIIESLPVKKHIRYGNCDDQWRSGNVMFTTFDVGASRHASDNAASCLLLVSMGDFNLLLTGDIEASEEYLLLGRKEIRAVLNNITVMSSPHHGSQTSSTPALLNQLQPKIIVISSGYLNRFGHPDQNISARYSARGIRVLDTAQTGAVRVQIGIAPNLETVRAITTDSGTLETNIPVSITVTLARDGRAGVWRRQSAH